MGSTGENDLQHPIEELVNQTHVNGDGFLVSVLSLKDGGGIYLHMFIFHERDGDAIYTVKPFSDKMNRVEGDEDSSLDENFSMELHAAENLFGPKSCVTYVVVNKDFRSSVIITSA